MTIYTIGHSNLAMARFIDLLRAHAIQLLVDTRSQPYSRYVPQFNREPLKASMEHAGIAYLHLGDQLGGRPRDAHYYRAQGAVDYARLAQAPFYQAGLERLKRAAEDGCLAIMCSEAGYKNCHRYHLITRSLVEEGIEVHHILHSGGLDATNLNDLRSEVRQITLPFE
jgi:uncharacterized protein (DUF488 family)